MSDDLKPCPFCGSTLVSEETNRDHWPVVMCDDCGATGPCINLGRNAANASWNARSLTEVLPKEQKTL
jgi:Lar family restriction alleviation protein